MKNAKITVALTLILCLMVQIMPMNVLAEGAAYAASLLQRGETAPEMDRVLQAAAEAGETRQNDEWTWLLLADRNLAVITGHRGTDARQLTVPVRLGGADVVGLAAEALADHAALEVLALPGNLRAVGERAIPPGVVVEGYNASYAQSWAEQRRYAFRNRSEWDFMQGVVDFADISTDAFVRVSQYEVRLRSLEAERLHTGSHFFLLDPNNLYQVSYYTVETMSDVDENGFVTLSCSTPVVEQIMNSVEIEDAVLVADPSTFETAPGVHMEAMTSRDYDRDEGWSVTAMDFKFKTDLDKTKNVSFAANANVNISGKTSASYSEDKKDVTSTLTLKGSVNGKLSFSKDSDLGDQKGSDNDGLTYKDVYDLMTQYAERYHGVGKSAYDAQLGRVMMFSAGGVVNVFLTFGFYVEVSATAEIGYTFSYTWKTKTSNDEQKMQDDQQKKYDLHFSAEGSIKAGVKVSIEVDFFFIKGFSAGIFLGVEGTATFDPSTTDSLDMLDTVKLSAKLVIEAEAEVAFTPIKLTDNFSFSPVKSMKVSATLFEWSPDWANWHFHRLPIDSKGEWKDKFHQDCDCPYDDLTLSFVLPFLPESDPNHNWSANIGTDSNPGQTTEKLKPQDVIREPDYPNLTQYGLALEGWYEDAAFTKKVKWPYTMPNWSVTLYGKSTPLLHAHFLMSDGTEAAQPITTSVEQPFTFPDARDGYDVTYWVELPAYPNMSLHGEILQPHDEYTMSDHDVYFAAHCSNDVEAYFYTDSGVVHEEVSTFLNGGTLNAPAVADREHYTFTGWKDGSGKQVTFPMKQAPGAKRYQHYYAIWEHNGAVIEKPGAGLSISGNGSGSGSGSQSGQSFFHFGYLDSTNGTCYVTGYNPTQTRIVKNSEGKDVTEYYTVDPVNIYVPSRYEVKNGDGTYSYYDVIGVSSLSSLRTLRSVSLPSSVEYIAPGCFANNPNLVSISMGSTSVTSIPSNFAANCPNLSSVAFSGKLTSIGDSAFKNCTSITSVTLGADIGSSAFAGCTSLSSVRMNGGVTAIGSSAFSGCTSLTELRIPDSVQTIGSSFLSGCLDLTEIDFDGRPATITKDMMYIGKGSHLTKVVLGDGVVNVGNEAFANNGYGFTELSDLSISMSVKSIGSQAFKGVAIRELTLDGYDLSIGANAFAGDKLERVTVKGGILSDHAFANCTALADISLGTGVSIGSYAFENCTSLDDPDLGGAVNIGSYAFHNCTGMKTLTIPDCVTDYGDYFIQGCTSLKKLVIGGGCKSFVDNSTYSNKFYIGSGAQLNYLEIREGVTALDHYEFANSNTNVYNKRIDYGFANLETVILPETLTSIGEKAFYQAGIDELTIKGNITSWGSNAFQNSGTRILNINGNVGAYAFNGSKSLQTVHMTGNGKIGSYAFNDCTALETVTIDEGKSSIGNHAFYGCSKLQALECPDSVTSYGDYFIQGCTSLKKLVIGGGCKSFVDSSTYSNKFYIGSGAQLNYLEIREGVTALDHYEFANSNTNVYKKRTDYGFSNLLTVILPESLTRIGEMAFNKAGIENLIIKGDILTWGSQVFRESTVKSLSAYGNIGERAFADCASLQKVTICGNGVTIGSYAFSGCSALEQIVLDEGVVKIGDHAFYGCSKLQALECPDSVASYGDYFIQDCTSLKKLVIGGGCKSFVDSSTYSNKFYIGFGAQLNYLEIREGVTALDQYEFANSCQNTRGARINYGFANLRTVILPESLTRIGENAFCQAGIDELTIKGNITSWGNYAFQNSGTRILNINGNVGAYAFNGCKSLQTVHMTGNGKIGSYAFNDCTALETVTIDEGKSSIGDHAFYGCSKLQALECPDSVTSYGNYFIQGCTSLKKLVIGGGCASFVDSSTDSNKFYIGSGAQLNYLEIREGVTALDQYEFANSFFNVRNNRINYGFANLRTVILPESLTRIGEMALCNSGIDELTIKGNITTWGSNAFQNSAIRSLTINGNVGANAFNGCKSLKSVHLTGEGAIGASAFSGCTALESVVIDEGRTSVGSYAFNGCSMLKSIEFPDSVTAYGDYMLQGCTGLTRLVIGGGCETLTYPKLAINGASALEYLEIREGVKTIDACALANTNSTSVSSFRKYLALTTVILPETLVTIGANNLNMLPALRRLVCGSEVTAIGSGTALATTGVTIHSGSFNELLDAIAQEGDHTYLYGGDLPAFTLTLMANCGGELKEVRSSEVAFREHLSLPTVHLDGWAMGEWYANEACTQRWQGGSMPAGDLTLYAKMLPVANVTWLVDSESTGGECVSDGWWLYDEDEEIVGSRMTALNPHLDNRTFEGWFMDEALTRRLNTGVDTVPADGLTVYGHFAPLYAADFVLVYPDGTTAPYLTKEYSSGLTVTEPEDPNVSGYALEGWYSEPELLHRWTAGCITSEGMTLYGRLVRVTAGGIYRQMEGGLCLESYVLQQDEGTEVYLPAMLDGQAVLAIGPYAFANTGVTLVNLPDALQEVDEHAFDDAASLSILRISSRNTAFAAKDGVLYSKDMTTLVRYPEHKTTADFTMPTTISAIVPGAFRSAVLLNTVSFPDGLTEIPEYAFYDCVSLRSITMPDSVTTLGKGAFAGCSGLTAFKAMGLTELGQDCLPVNYATQVTGPVGEGVLREYCMATVGGLTYFAMPYNTCTLTLNVNGKNSNTLSSEIGALVNVTMLRAMMEGFESLDHLNSDPSPVMDLSNGTMITGWYRDADCTMPWSMSEDCITGSMTLYTKTINKYTYTQTEFVIGTDTEEEGNETPVTISGLLLTGYYGKGGAVVLPDVLAGVRVLGLGEGMLKHANGQVTSVSIGSGVLQIADSAFDDSEGNAFTGSILTNPGTFAETWAQEHGLLQSDRRYTLSFETYGAFMRPVSAASGTVIRVAAPVRTGATFAGWYLDKELKQPTALENGVLFTMSAEDTILYAAWEITGEEPEYTFFETSEGTITITGYTGSEVTLTLPDGINGLPVTAIAPRAFADMTLKRVTLPESITEVGAHAFDGTVVYSIDLGGVQKIGEYAFAGCRRLNSLTMTAVENIGEGAFSDCVSLTAIGLPETVTTIGEYAFKGCIGLTEMTLPDRAAILPAYVFSDCASLKRVTLGSGMMQVMPGTFWRCEALTDILVNEENPDFVSADGILYSAAMDALVVYPQGRTDMTFAVPKSVMSIECMAFANAVHLKQITLTGKTCYLGEAAFRGCTGLTSFVLPADCVTPAIPTDAFADCTALTDVALNSFVQEIGNGAFMYCKALKTVTISPETTKIQALAFGNGGQLTLIGRTGSAADAYADEHGLKFTDPYAMEITSMYIVGETVMQRGDTQQLTLKVLPEGAAGTDDIVWSSSDPTVARVTNGYVQALAGGQATIRAAARNGVTADMTIEVQVAVSALSLQLTEATMARGEQLTAECIIYPATATNKKLTWTTTDEQVAAVDENGCITMMGVGSAVITVISHNGMTAEIALTVFNAVEAVNPEEDDLTLCTLGATSEKQIEVTILPEDATSRELLWSSSDEKVVTVENGLLRAVGAGMAEITVTAADAHAVQHVIAVSVKPLDLTETQNVFTAEALYTGRPLTPTILLTADGVSLEQDVHYTVTGEEMTDAGEYLITVTGIGLCAGEVEDVPFTVLPATPELVWHGAPVIQAGSMPEIAYEVTPACCPVAVTMRNTTPDTEPTDYVPDSSLPVGHYEILLTVGEDRNWHAASFTAALDVIDIRCSANVLTMEAGQRLRLAVSGLPAGFPEEELMWESSDEAVTVDEHGVLTAAAVGNAQVRVSVGWISAACDVTIVENAGLHMKLPAALKKIESDAFAGTAAGVIELPASVMKVESGAFADSTALYQLICPASFEAAPDLLRGSEQAVLVCPAGSPAEAFCRRMALPYVLMAE